MKNSFPHRSCILAVLIGLFIFYMPAKAQTEERMRSREEFRECGLGIFIHWGIYSLYGDGEWIMAQKNIHRSEYTKAASAFYPSRFDAEAWVKAIKASGAKYICFTSRHHDGFSMWDSQATDYTIVRATPYGRDVLKELADACHKEGIRLHLYYSLVDWYREDYLRGWSGPEYDKDPQKADYDSYMRFMKQQLTELLTNYGEIGAIWFDGMWDHKEEQRDELMYKGTMYNVQRDDVQSTKEWSWCINELYELIHTLQPACLIANNHHLAAPLDGEDIQCFERDVPGENKGGYSEGMSVSRSLPLETCETMNHSWGYSVTDTGYKSIEQVDSLRTRVAEMGANLLLNIGPQPNGELPEKALELLRQMGAKSNH